MRSKARSLLPSPSMTVALIAVAIALSGTAYAASTIGTSQIRDGAVTPPKLASGAVTGQKIRNNAVTSAKVKDGTLLAKDFRPGELVGGQVQGAPGPQGPQGPSGAQGPSGPGSAATVALAPGAGLGSTKELFTIGHASFFGVCAANPAGAQAGIGFTAVGGGIRVRLSSGDTAAGLPYADGQGVTTYIPANTVRVGTIAVIDEAGPSFTGQYAAYASGVDGPCIVTAHVAG